MTYGLKRTDCIEAFFKNIDRKAVEARLTRTGLKSEKLNLRFPRREYESLDYKCG